jgi:hypothetical protein
MERGGKSWQRKISLPSGNKLPQTPRFNQLWKRYQKADGHRYPGRNGYGGDYNRGGNSRWQKVLRRRNLSPTWCFSVSREFLQYKRRTPRYVL